MGYDPLPERGVRDDARESCSIAPVKEEWVNVFEHDPDVAMGIIRKG